MLDQETSTLTEFVHRYCAVDASEDEPRTGYFAFCAGTSARSARKAREPIVVRGGEDLAQLTAKVLRRASELSQSGEGNVFVRFYYEGASSFEDQLKIEGKKEENDDIDGGGSAMSALAQAMVATNRLLIEDSRELRRGFQQQQIMLLDQTEKIAAYTVHAMFAEEAMKNQGLSDALTILGPTVDKVAPKVADAFATWLGAASALPTKPEERIKVAVDRIAILSQEIGKTMVEHPNSVPADAVAKLVQLMHVYAETFGFELRKKGDGGDA